MLKSSYIQYRPLLGSFEQKNQKKSISGKIGHFSDKIHLNMRTRAGLTRSFCIGFLSFSHRINKTILSRSNFKIFLIKQKLTISWLIDTFWVFFFADAGCPNTHKSCNFYIFKKIFKLLRDTIVLLIRCEKLRNRVQNEHVRPSRTRAQSAFLCKLPFSPETLEL